jgi:hypothetical protein
MTINKRKRYDRVVTVSCRFILISLERRANTQQIHVE